MDKIIITATAFGIKHTIELSDDSGIEDFFVGPGPGFSLSHKILKYSR